MGGCENKPWPVALVYVVYTTRFSFCFAHFGLFGFGFENSIDDDNDVDIPDLTYPVRSIELVVNQPFAANFLEGLQTVRLPSTSLLYDARITIDMASMIYARRNIFCKSNPKKWIIHLRADSSPQFGRDYYVPAADIVYFGTNAGDTIIERRLLPIQSVGSRAGYAHQKMEKLIFSLTLESEHVSCTVWKE